METLNWIFNFGKYKGEILENVLKKDMNYIDWCYRFSTIFNTLVNSGMEKEQSDIVKMKIVKFRKSEQNKLLKRAYFGSGFNGLKT